MKTTALLHFLLTSPQKWELNSLMDMPGLACCLYSVMSNEIQSLVRGCKLRLATRERSRDFPLAVSVDGGQARPDPDCGHQVGQEVTQGGPQAAGDGPDLPVSVPVQGEGHRAQPGPHTRVEDVVVEGVEGVEAGGAVGPLQPGLDGEDGVEGVQAGALHQQAGEHCEQ